MNKQLMLISGVNSPANSDPIEFTIKLNYLNAGQAGMVLSMFDNEEDFAEYFSALKAITRGLYKILEDCDFKEDKIKRMFKVVNELQGRLLPEDMQQTEQILKDSGLMPDPWQNYRKTKGGNSCA